MINLPKYALNVGMFAVTQNKLAIMSGRFTPSVYIFEIDSNPRNKHKAGNSLDESYKLYEIDGWGKPVETLYPILYVSERNIVYVLKGRSG